MFSSFVFFAALVLAIVKALVIILITSNQRIFTRGHITRGIFHWENLVWHLTASVASQMERWSTACGEILTSGAVRWEWCSEACRKIPTSLPFKNSPSRWVSGSPFSTLAHSTLQSTSQTASRLVQPFMHGSRSLQTDRPRNYVCSNRPHLASAAMWSNNKWYK